jgi:hypothetical protein
MRTLRTSQGASRFLWMVWLGLVLPAAPAATFAPLAAETFMASQISAHAEQRRTRLDYHPTLNFIARHKAEDMAKRAYFSHIDPDGFGPNFSAHVAGYQHSYSIAPSANSIESIGVRHQNNLSANEAAKMVFESWMNSPPHRTHVLGMSGFESQTFYGVGYGFARQGPFGWNSHYFVFVSAPPDTNAVLTEFVIWQFNKLTLKDLAFPGEDPDQDGLPNVWEYALDWNPLVKDGRKPFSFQFDRQLRRGALTIPLRTNLDPTVRVVVETSVSLTPSSWTSQGVNRTGSTFIAGGPADQLRFFRVDIRRDRADR